ncbi:hypothetical protein P3H15_31430 [Rhodococcus sp. T2V]|uniref:hypothetical protein n=1 Tax=Rhodococcus sp. T2V TaxID=3034164 RepID=UPI0023E2BBAE|nr:hypothetical protein [Rhodococcus sp. T2V]MDF3309533.1 hypothetical protein [Rhodococcus sp. T2V]
MRSPFLTLDTCLRTADPEEPVYQRAYAPELADRAYVLTRLAFEKRADGKLRTKAPDTGFDVGNYGKGSTLAYPVIAFAMREAGDEDLAVAALSDLQEKREIFVDSRGWLTVEGASNLVHGELASAMLGRKGTWLNMLSKGMPDRWANGPLIESVPYPDVLVGRAVSNDGADLEAVFHPGTRDGRRSVEVSQLTPGRTYTLRGAVEDTTVASDEGTARIDIDIVGRTELHITPA